MVRSSPRTRGPSSLGDETPARGPDRPVLKRRSQAGQDWVPALAATRRPSGRGMSGRMEGGLRADP